MRPLYKTTVVIWSEYEGVKLELSALAREAEEGNAYCSRYGSELVSDPAQDETWDGTEFFGIDAEECEECGADIPDSEPDLVNASHDPSCSLYPHDA